MTGLPGLATGAPLRCWHDGEMVDATFVRLSDRTDMVWVGIAENATDTGLWLKPIMECTAVRR